ncbi:protein transporter Sec31 [Streptomyces roseifaciens]
MKFRAVTRKRQVPHTLNGITEMVDQNETVPAAVLPRDWDHLVHKAVTITTTGTVATSVAWSAASIGDLLARVTHPAAAYAAAGIFDLAWITCMATEWLARYDHDRVKLPRIAGYVALAIAMLSVGTHGWIEGSKEIGYIGAAVSLIAKGMWTVTLQHSTPVMDDLTRQWLAKQRAKIAARTALAVGMRQLARAEEFEQAQRAALAASRDRTVPSVETGEEDRHEPLSTTPETAVPPAVLALAEQLLALGVTPALGQSQTALTSEDNAVPEQLQLDLDTVRPLSRPGETVSDSVRAAIAAGIRAKSAVLRHVHRVHGADVKADSVARILNRELNKKKAG